MIAAISQNLVEAVELPKLLREDTNVYADTGDFGRVEEFQRNAILKMMWDAVAVKKKIVAVMLRP